MILNKKKLIHLFISLLLISPLVAKEKTVSPNAKCLSCHKIESVCEAKLKINENYFFAAVGTDCHGFHDIRPADDPLSKVNRANLAKTCGQESCHPGTPNSITNTKIHAAPAPKKTASDFAQTIIFGIIIFAAVITAIWFIPRFMNKDKKIQGESNENN